MKERIDSIKILREPSVNCPLQEAAIAGGITKLDSADVMAEGKDDDGRKSSDMRPPSRKITNGDSDAKIEKIKPASVGAESMKSSPQNPPSRGTTPAMMSSQHGLLTSLEPPFVQQQSQIFVFSTGLANEAADSVRQGHCKNIIQYHMDHPNIKAFLQKLKADNPRESMMEGMKSLQGSGMVRMPGPSQASWGPHQPPMMEGMMGPEGMMSNGQYHHGGPGSRMMSPWSSPHPHASMGPRGHPLGSMMDMEIEMMMRDGHIPSGLPSSQIPDDNLTLEQRQHRSRSLAQLTKIHKMLMGGSRHQDGRPQGHDGHTAGPGMCPDGPGMMASQQQTMMPHHAMMSQGGMMPPHGMMSPQHQHMMAHQAMAPYGHRGFPGMRPPRLNGKDQYQTHPDWYHIQREFFTEKQHSMQHMTPNRGPHLDSGPPPPYYSSPPQNHGSMGSPPLNGMRMSMHPFGPMGPGMDFDGMRMYGSQPDMCRPSHMGMDSIPEMHGYPSHLPPHGPMHPGFDPTIVGGIPPGTGPGPPCPSAPQHHDPLHHGHMDLNGMMPGLKSPTNQVTLHRAGNPEQFNPETMGGVMPHISSPVSTSNSNKPPPSYAQAQKRKRGSDTDDSYTKGNLQQTPSPTKIHYHLSQFEGQELTITKQLNTAYVANDTMHESSAVISSASGNTTGGASVGHFNNHASSPLHGPGSNKGPSSNSSQSSAHMVSSPAVSTKGMSPQGPGTPLSTHTSSSGSSLGANIRLSHFDPAPLSNGISTSPHTPTPKASSMSNITSASLANLAKGVENLSNQMQQNMLQGGPFHSIQVQGQIATSSNSGSSNITSSSGSVTTAVTTVSSSSTNSASSHPVTTTASQAPGISGVNSTYTSTTAYMPNHPSMSSFVHEQLVRDVASEPTSMNIPPCGMQHSMGSPMGSGMMGGGPRSEIAHQNQGMIPSKGSLSSRSSPGIIPDPHMSSGMNPIGTIPPHLLSSSTGMPATPPTMPMSQFTSPSLSHPQMSGPAPLHDITTPSFSVTSNSNSNVQIQQKGHNTIQYLPANPPNTQSSASHQRPDLDYNMQCFPSDLHTKDGRSTSSTLQYFPNSSPAAPRPSHLSSSLSAAMAMGPEFANQATIAMHQSASMMRSSSLPDLQTMQGSGSGMPPSSMVSMGPSPMMHGPDPILGVGNISHMRPGHSPGPLHPVPPSLGSARLECVSPNPGMGGYMNSGPSIEQAQAQAQAHAARMMQGNSQLPVSSPHGPMPPCSGHSPHMGPIPTCSGPSPHMGPMPPCGGPSPHMGSVPPCGGPSPHMGPMPPGGPSPHMGPMPPGGPSPHMGPMPPYSGLSSHMGPMPPYGGGPSSHMGPMPPYGGPSPHAVSMSPYGGPSPHMGPMPSYGGPSPQTTSIMSTPGTSLHGPMLPEAQGPSIRRPTMSEQSPHGAVPCSGVSAHQPMSGTVPDPSYRGHIPGPLHHSAMMGPIPPHGHMGHLHGPAGMGHLQGASMPSSAMPRQSGVGGMRVTGPGMGSMPGHYGMQYPGYQSDYFPTGPQRGPSHQIMPNMMGGPGHPYGMMSSMPGPG